ncbi:MAG: response regulator transcription factor [Campylobacterales bacterium]|nr:response regulator transcription factor [Campylobacterales bacterium]
MKILAVDDEKLARDRLHRLLSSFDFELQIAENSTECLQLMEKSSFDIFILDINMPDINGIDLGRKIKQISPNSAIIYQTAYKEHSIEAFNVGAIHYLLKPYTKEDLKNAIDRVSAISKNRDIKFLTKDKDEFYLLKPDDIYYIKSDLYEVIFRTKDNFFYYNKTISQIEIMLKDYEFFRIHRSYLINLNKIKQMNTFEQSKIEFSFIDIKDVIYSSKDGAKNFRNYFKIMEG